MATTSGQTLAAELGAAGVYRSLVEGPDGVPKALLGFNGVPIINTWIKAASDCPRLMPLVDQVCTWVAACELAWGGREGERPRTLSVWIRPSHAHACQSWCDGQAMCS